MIVALGDVFRTGCGRRIPEGVPDGLPAGAALLSRVQ